VTGELSIPDLPRGAEVAVALTFDVDAECGVLAQGIKHHNRLTELSEARFGVVRGLPRILELLAELELPGTFYVPGDTAERHADLLAGLLAGPHEIAHHGHFHLRSDVISAAGQREEIERGLDSLRRNLGIVPRGYRSPSWEMTPETFALLVARGFDYDSSCMGDDRPYVETHDGRSILELPVHWSLDDWPYFNWTGAAGGSLQSPVTVLDVWRCEFDSALVDGRLMTLTMHPEVIGRGYRMGLLRSFLEWVSGRAKVWFATHSEIVDHLRPTAE
jgi:peptidoglycan-N-acetylglucosamine deacetylase